MSRTDDAGRDEFMCILRAVLRAEPCLDKLREETHFRAMLAIHGSFQVRGWVVLEGLRLAREVALDESPDLTDGEAWLRSGVLQRLCENADYLVERIAS
jgi:hypothetical protein